MTFSQKSLLVIPIGYSILVFADIGYMQMQKQKKQDLLEDMQIMLTAITNTYNFCPNFNIAIESNKNILSGEIKNAFDKYLTICEIAGSDYIRNLEAIKPMINHYLWENWIEAVKESIRASNKKIQLSYIIDDINKACDFNEIVENEVFKGKQDFMLSIVLTLAGMLLVTFLYDGGIEAILNTWLGNLVLAVTLCIILFTYHGCISMLLNASYEKLEVK